MVGRRERRLAKDSKVIPREADERQHRLRSMDMKLNKKW